MKKFVILLMVLVLGVGSLALASGIDLSALTDEQLSALYTEVTQAIVDRKIEKTAHLEAGKYVAGSDIPFGEYVLLIDNSEGKYGINLIYISPEDGESVSGPIYGGKVYRKRINMIEGCTLEVRGNFDLLVAPDGWALQFE